MSVFASPNQGERVTTYYLREGVRAKERESERERARERKSVLLERERESFIKNYSITGSRR